MKKTRVSQPKGVKAYFVPEEADKFEAKCAVLRASELTGHQVELEYRNRADQWEWEFWLRASYKDGSDSKFIVWTIAGFNWHQSAEAKRALLQRAVRRGFCAVHVCKVRPAATDAEVQFIEEFNAALRNTVKNAARRRN